MAEPTEPSEVDADVSADEQSSSAGDFSAVELALKGVRRRRTRRAAGSDPAADYLDAQTRLARLQMEHLHEQRLLNLNHLRWRRFSDRMKGVLQVGAVLTAVGVVAAVGAMAWQAHEDHGLVVEAFSVPPELAQRGLSGQVVAAEVLDRLSSLQAQTSSQRPAGSYRRNWGEEIKIEVPQTGLTLSEVDKLLRRVLGHESRISGAVYRRGDLVSLTARSSEEGGGRTFTGPDTDFDVLLQQATEAIYAKTQPYRYGIYLAETNRVAEAQKALRELADDGEQPIHERAWAEVGLGFVASDIVDDPAEALRAVLDANALDPSIPMEAQIAANSEAALSHEEAALRWVREWRRRLGADHGREVRAGRAEFYAAVSAGDEAAMTGDFQAASRWRRVAATLRLKRTAGSEQLLEAAGLSLQAHDPTPALDLLRAPPPGAEPPGLSNLRLQLLESQANWAAALPLARSRLAPQPRGAPWRAELRIVRALAGMGDLAEASRELSLLPADCDACLIARAELAARSGDLAGAERFFRAETARAPSTIEGFTAWGRVELERGYPARALDPLKSAHANGPRDPNPLELLGEALLRLNRPAEAAQLFSEAAHLAPHWRRLHEMWAAALTARGRKADAEAERRLAARLSPA